MFPWKSSLRELNLFEAENLESMCDIEDRISRVTEQLENLEEEKSLIEEKVDRTMRDITRLTKSIIRAEREVQKAAKSKLTRDYQERLKGDIFRLKKEQKRAERLMDVYDRQLVEAHKQYTRCKGEIYQ